MGLIPQDADREICEGEIAKMNMALRQVGFKSLVLPLCLIWLSLTSASAQTNTNEIVLYSSTAVKAGNWSVVADSTAAGGARIANPDQNGAKLANAIASPSTYFDMTFNADANKNYRLWIRGKAESNSPYNDSFFVQFSGSVDSSGSAQYRIGTTSSTVINVEDDSGRGLSGWGWQDNGWGVGVMGPLIRFASTGTQTIRIQPREDGISIDQIVLSSQTYLNSSPGALLNDSTILPIAASASDTVIWASDVSTMAGSWTRVTDNSAAGGYAMRNPDGGAGKLGSPLASPASYFEANFNAESGKAYRLWIRGKAQNDDPYNDSIFLQFSGTVISPGGSATYRIGTTSGTTINLEDDSGVGLSGWGWQDNGWGRGVMGPVIYFGSTGTQTIRVQTREDGLSIDQIVLSSQTYLGTSPGSLMNDSLILPSTIGGGAPPPPPNQLPQVSISASIASGFTPLSIGFNSSAYDPDGYIASYSWNFGDGQTSSQASPSYTYTTVGVFTARLTVTDNAGATASATTLITVLNILPPPPGGVQFKVLDWNIQMGQGTDYVYDLNRTATYIANQTPDVATLCEVLLQSWGDNQGQILANRLTQITGVTWYYYFAEKFSGSEEGNLILSKWPFINTSKRMLSYDRSVARATININGKSVTVFATHLDPDSGYARSVQISELTSWASGFSGPRVLTGDFNAWPGAGEIGQMTSLYNDAWNDSVSAGTASAYPDNPVNAVDTRTRRARIDYIFYSRGTGLSVVNAKVPDIRDLSRTPSEYLGTLDDRGVRPSDHNLTVVKLQVD
jgi:endonuclease/exonuclease/phosphatase family metal-dependent hydrolase